MGALAAAAFLSAVVSLQPIDDMPNDSVDLVEVNHFYDEHGRLVFDQIIFYDWCDVQCRYNVCAWRMLKRASQHPQRDWKKGSYDAVWHENGVLRRVSAKAMRETWTQYDPELIERDFLPKEHRRELQTFAARKTEVR